MVAVGERARRPPPRRRPAAPPARRLLGVAPDVLAAAPLADIDAAGTRRGPPGRGLAPGPGPRAGRRRSTGRSSLLADHELATSTLAVRVAGSTSAGPVPGVRRRAGRVQGRCTAAPPARSHDLLVECERRRRRPTPSCAALPARERLPGFGHKIYDGDDPRLGPAARGRGRCCPTATAAPASSTSVVAEAGVRMTKRPNVDLGVGALTFVAGLPADVPLFAVARIAGFAAHLDEELDERPLRYRGLARPRG